MSEVGSTAIESTSVMPIEGWERLRDGLRGWVRGVLAGRARLASWLFRARVWALWGALALLLAMALLMPRYRASLVVYLSCYWILIIWFATARTKTITWAGLARMFSIGVVWSWAIAWMSGLLVNLTDLSISAAGPGTAIAAFTEESLKLVPLIALVLIAPGRVRRLAAVDWLLLGLALGLGFQAWEDLLRRLAQEVLPRGILDFLTDGGGSGSGYPQYGWGLLSGGSGRWTAGDVYGYAGHHVFTALVAASAGLGIAAWRRAGTRTGRSRWQWRATGVGLPILAWLLVVMGHFGYNAALRDSRWVDAPHMSAPWLLRFTWSHFGKGAGMGWLLLVLFLVCLMVDADRLQRAGPVTDLPGLDPQASGWIAQPHKLVDRWTAPRAVPPWLHGLARRLAALGVHAGRDLTVMVAAHARQGNESRRAAIGRGRAVTMMLREVRGQAIESVLPAATTGGGSLGDDGGWDVSRSVSDERRARQVTRLVAAAALAVTLFAASVVAVTVAQKIGVDLTPRNGVLDWLAGQFDGLARWWSRRSLLEKILLGAAVAALVGLSGGSLGLALGISGVATYAAEHGLGAADFIRDPRAATRSYLNTTTPLDALVDLLEFGLTFAPGNFAGAATGRYAASRIGAWRFMRGGWTGPNGLRLSGEQFRGVQASLARAAANEPAITTGITRVADALPSGRLIGLDHRLKEVDSLARKVASDLDDPAALAQTLDAIKDNVRYTMSIPTGNYIQETTEAVRGLKSAGFEPVQWKSAWGESGTGYQGVNSWWRDPDSGQIFEVQFHTPESFDAKMVTHGLYEQRRVPGVDPAVKDAIRVQEGEIFDAIPRPEGSIGFRPEEFAP